MSIGWPKFLLVAYLLTGMVYAGIQYDKSLRTFVCEDDTAPHAEVGMYFGDTYMNPDPERCRRAALSAEKVIGYFVMVFVGPLIAVLRLLA